MSNKGLLPRPFRRQRLSILLSLLLNGFCQALSVLTMAWLLSSGLTVEDGVIRIAPVTAVSLLALASALIALRTSERASAERLGQLYVTSCRTRLYRALASQPVSGAPVSRLGLNMTRMITDLTALKNWVGYGIAQLAVSAMSLIGVVVAIFFVSPVLATAAANTIMLLLVLGTAASIYLGVAIRSARRIRGRLAANVGGQMLAPRLAQHFQRDQREKRRIRDQSITMTNELSRWRGIAGFMRSLPDATFPLIVVSLGLGVYLQATPISLDLAELTTIFLLIGLLVSPLRSIMLSLEYYMAYREGRYRLETVLGRYETRDRAHNPKVDESPGAKVLSFQSALPAHDPPLANVSLARGETALLTGVSGSGKTAFMNLIAGLNESAHPESPISQLAIDHFTMDSMSRMQWHAKTKLVSPKLPLTKGSLRRNLRLGSQDLSDKSAETILARCGVSFDDDHMNRGLDTRIADGGANLPDDLHSRILLARALAAKPGVLLVDHPLFATQGEAQDALANVLSEGQVIAIVAASRQLSCAKLPITKVWELSDGLLVELSKA